MKKIFKSLILFAAAATVFSACNKEADIQETAEIGGMQKIQFSAFVNDVETKATLTTADEATFTAAWENGDEMAIEALSVDADYEGSGTATWNGSFFDTDLPTNETVGEWTYDGYYPAKTNIPFGSARIQNGSNYASAYDIMKGDVTYQNALLGKDPDGGNMVIPMTRLTSIIYFHLTSSLDEALASATLTVEGGNIAAEAVSINNGAVVADAGTNTITITFAEGTAPSARDFCLWYNILPVTATGLTLTVTTTSGKTATLTNTKGKTYAAGKLNKIVKSVTFEEGEKYYVKVTSDEEIVAGDYLIVYESLDEDLNEEAEILSGVENKIGTVATSAIITDGDIKKIAQSGNEAYNIVAEESDEGYTLKLGEGYLAYNLPAGTTKNNNLFLAEIATETGAEWILSVDGIRNAYNTERYLQFNKDRFACYAGTQNDVSLYLLEGSGHSTSKKPAGLAYATTEYEITIGDEFIAPELTNPNSLTVTYVSDNTDVATVNQNTGAVTIVAVGTAKITASFAGNDEYRAGSAFYTITVNPVKDYLFYESFDEFSGTGGNDNLWNGSIASKDWGTPDNEGWVVENANSANKCAKFGTGSKKGTAITPALGITDQTTATMTFKAGAWNGTSENLTLNISIEGAGQASVKSVTLAKGEFTDYTVILGNGINATTKVKFAAAQVSNNRFFLDEVKVVAGGEMPIVKQDPTLTFSSSEVEVTLGQAFSAPTLTTDPAGLTVSYSSSKPDVATVNENTGEVTLVSAGTTTITATFAGNANYYEASASYTLKVNSNVDNGDGTLDNPFNIAGAYEYINNSGSEDVYVKGIISRIDEGKEYSESYGTAVFWISDDGKTDSDQFEAFSVYFLGNRSWKEGNTQIKVGDEVILYGKLTKYNTTYETSSKKAYLYSLNNVSAILDEPVVSISVDKTAKTITVGWDVVPGATSYIVNCGEQTYTAESSETTHVFTMSEYGTYSVRVLAKSSNIETSISDVIEAILSDPTTPTEPVTLIIDGSKLTSTATTSVTTHEYDGVNVTFSSGAKQQSSTGNNKFSDKAIFIGKSGAYIHAEVPGTITKFEIYANKGASAKVSVGVNFSASPINSYNETSTNTFTATLSSLDHVYDCSDKLAENTKYFWYQVTNANNSQVEFRITYIPN